MQEVLMDRCVINNRFETVFIFFDDIYYVKKDRRKINICTKDLCYWEYGTLDDVLFRLDGRMCRCNGSLAVNMDKVSLIRQGRLSLRNEVQFYLGRLSFRNTKQQLLQYYLHLRAGKQKNTEAN
jgi:DNA-binding LytR/AlgR family response regulator